MDERFQELVLFNFLKVPNPRICMTLFINHMHKNLTWDGFQSRFHRSIQFIIHRREEVKGHQILLCQFLQGHLGRILGRSQIAVDFVLETFVAPGNSADEPLEKAFAFQSARISWRPVLRIPGRRWNFP